MCFHYRPPDIPSNAAITYEVELLSVEPPVDPCELNEKQLLEIVYVDFGCNLYFICVCIQSDLFTTSPLVVLPYTSIQSDLFTTSPLVVLPYTSICTYVGKGKEGSLYKPTLNTRNNENRTPLRVHKLSDCEDFNVFV